MSFFVEKYNYTGYFYSTSIFVKQFINVTILMFKALFIWHSIIINYNQNDKECYIGRMGGFR